MGWSDVTHAGFEGVVTVVSARSDRAVEARRGFVRSGGVLIEMTRADLVGAGDLQDDLFRRLVDPAIDDRAAVEIALEAVRRLKAAVFVAHAGMRDTP